ncbi:hypothetical protein Pcar_3229 [Syntrophotalea carbinolica DSM 2380]|uniref:Uncharacterized protein n=1 Tax=Syntrophotalea carbinolica (strain DSM 2380 / NBRC 103641 / GraBd1) TaxID=338963 RepID=Q0C6T8_SYNC1|nr:hypothetical protein Pcar_3229 [Syntrophotalea carbinolica DSM 2380]
MMRTCATVSGKKQATPVLPAAARRKSRNWFAIRLNCTEVDKISVLIDKGARLDAWPLCRCMAYAIPFTGCCGSGHFSCF